MRVNSIISLTTPGPTVWKNWKWKFHFGLPGTIYTNPSLCHSPGQLGMTSKTRPSSSSLLFPFIPLLNPVIYNSCLLTLNWSQIVYVITSFFQDTFFFTYCIDCQLLSCVDFWSFELYFCIDLFVIIGHVTGVCVPSQPNRSHHFSRTRLFIIMIYKSQGQGLGKEYFHRELPLSNTLLQVYTTYRCNNKTLPQLITML